MPDSNWDREFQRIFADPGEKEAAPTSLKARLYTRLVREQQKSGQLASLEATVAAGHGVCVFEKLVQIAPVGDRLKTPFFCGVCHARTLGEHFDRPPIFWSNCPYVAFKKS
ncbi:MAG TPA: hypothetical protein VJP83_17145 [Terriglobales bacterium]|nr:hypothetical protein [Terriglobales bacterium]